MTDIKQEENESKIPLSAKVVVLERELKNSSSHSDVITGIINLNEHEFLTCGIEQSFKVWDKQTQQCDYTIETHMPLNAMAVTGEKGDMLIASLGEGNLIVYGLTHKNQLDIVEAAHATTVVQIVSLSKLKNKYFATRCLSGHVNIWSATNHPDRLFTIENVDKEDSSSGMAATLQGAGDTGNMSSESGWVTSASDRDKMIELKWKFMIQTSSTVLCFSNFNDQKVIVTTVDLKTRRKNIIKTLRTNCRPTFLYQIDENYLLVGTEYGFIEKWSLDEQLIDSFEAHPSSTSGISAIIELKQPSDFIWEAAEAQLGYQIPYDKRYKPPTEQEKKSEQSIEKRGPVYKILATIGSQSNQIKMWVMTNENEETYEITQIIKIDTSLENGINFLLESQPNQIVAIDKQKTVKFYDFIDKQQKEEEEKQEAEDKKLTQIIKDLFNETDIDKNGKLEYEEFIKVLKQILIRMGFPASEEIGEETNRMIFGMLDGDQSGTLSRFEIKAYIKTLREMGFLKEGE